MQETHRLLRCVGGADLVTKRHGGADVVRVDRLVRPLRRVAMLSVHTSPLDQPGTGDAGGMNVYVVELSRQLAAHGIAVDIFTRATSRSLPPVVELAPGIVVRHVVAGPLEGLTKTELPGQLCTFAREVLRTEASYAPGYYDVLHSHYWLSGQVGALARDRWGVPLVHSMHTMAKVKNSLLAEGDVEEPLARLIGEGQVVEAADLIIANTAAEGRQLIDLYAAEPERVRVISPGVDLTVFTPGDRQQARARLGIAADALVAMFVGRIQPLKAPDLVIKAAALLLRRRPELRERLVVPVIGGPSGSGLESPRALIELAASLGVSDVVSFVPPLEQHELVGYYRAATLVCVPSYNESFGLVAIEAQACGTPVVAADVGGLSTAVADGSSGFLIDGHDPSDYADAFERLMSSPVLAADLGRAGVEHARGFGWERTASETLAAYDDALQLMRSDAVAMAE
ncbi:MAG: D-inositol-3-phosphate glycosyltransferase [Nocardioidaceae bacterium]|nr:D-inositol-3-phosphate glycosyltransferase [Nocardioidaceae bacterium]